MPGETIRQFQSHDAEACNLIVRACLELEPLMPLLLKKELLRAESPAVMCERASCFYVAVYLVDDAVAAVGAVELNEIRLLFVAPGHQRRGIGSSLLSHLETWVPCGLFSDIFVYSAPASAGFYRSHGYEPGGEHLFVIGDCTMPTIFMTKKLARQESAIRH